MSSPIPIKEPLQTVTSPADVERFTKVIASAFANDPLNHYFYLGKESHPENPKLEDFNARVGYWKEMIQPRVESGAWLVQSHDWAAVALWLPPGVEKPTPPGTVLSEGLREYIEFFQALRNEKLGTRPHWHLNLIGRDPERKDRGAITDIFNPVLEDAKAKNIPIWLDCTNLHARQVYERFGFKVVGDVRIGKGVVDGEGWAKEGGEGILLWGMIAGLDGCRDGDFRLMQLVGDGGWM